MNPNEKQSQTADYLKKLNEAQQEAVDYLEGPLLVLAGPGTGKTQLLSSRVAHILQTTDTAPENILCLTYTDNGAENMRERILSLTESEAEGVNVFTYHAFGRIVLREYQNYAPDVREFGEPVDEVTQLKIIQEIQDGLPARDILRRARPRDIREVIESAKNAGLEAEDLSIIAKENLKRAEAINKATAPILAHVYPRMPFDAAIEEVYQPLLETLIPFTGKNIIDRDQIQIEPEANSLVRDLATIIATQQAAPKPKLAPLTEWRNKNFDKNSFGEHQLSDRVANLRLQSLSKIMRAYSEKLSEEGWVDFADMIIEAVRRLRDDRGFQLTLSERFQYILLDEFQDTNPMQFEIIKLLTAYEKPQVMAVGDDDQAICEFQGADASNLLNFQNHYQAKVIVLTKNYRSTAEILDLSYKIREQISGSFTKKFRDVTKRLVACTDWREQKDGIARHEFVAADAENCWIADEIRKLLDAGERPDEIAVIVPKHKYLAPLIPYLTAENIPIAYEKRENILEDQRIHELIVLARFCYALFKRENPAHLLMELLSFDFWKIPPLETVLAVSENRRAHALKILTESENPKLVTIAGFLATLALQAPDTPLELWLSQAIGVAEIKVANDTADNWLKSSEKTPNLAKNSQISAENAQNLPETAGNLAKNAQNSGENIRKSSASGENTFTTFRSPFLDFYAGDEVAYSTFSLYENLHSLRSAILHHSQNRQLKLADLIEFLDDYERAGAGILNTSPYQDATRSVQLMTVHKAKGLEFKHVFLPAVDSISWGKGKGNNDLMKLPPNLVQIRHTGETPDERLRVFFVALTRAKETLLMTNSVQDFSGKTPRRLEYLAEREEHRLISEVARPLSKKLAEKIDNKTVVSPLLPEESRLVNLHTKDIDEARRRSDLQATWMAFYESPTPELTSILKARMRDYRVNASDLTKFIDLIYAGPVKFYLDRVLRAPSEPLSASLALGNLVHTVFERVTNQKISDAEALELFQEELKKQPLAENDRRYVRERGEVALKTSLRVFNKILRDANAHGEVNFSTERPRLAKLDIPLTGKIDHLTVNSTDRTLEIYDFKTGKPHPEYWRKSKSPWQSYPTLFKYKLQLGVYKLLLNNSRLYRDYRVTRGHILFVDPDDAEEKVYDRVYEFSDHDERELVRLIKSFYHHATTLDFVSDPELMIEPDKGRTFKQIREFVQKLTAE